MDEVVSSRGVLALPMTPKAPIVASMLPWRSVTLTRTVAKVECNEEVQNQAGFTETLAIAPFCATFRVIFSVNYFFHFVHEKRKSVKCVHLLAVLAMYSSILVSCSMLSSGACSRRYILSNCSMVPCVCMDMK